jgi:hypothetical protein
VTAVRVRAAAAFVVFFFYAMFYAIVVRC